MPISKWTSKFKRLVHNSFGNMACIVCEMVKKLYYSEYNFEKMITPQKCIYDLLVQEYIHDSENHHTGHNMTIYVINNYNNSNDSRYIDSMSTILKSSIHNLIGRNFIIVDLYDPLSLD